MLNTTSRQEEKYIYTDRYCRLLASLSKLLIGNEYMAVGCINQDIDTNSLSLLLSLLYNNYV
jgi:hypothetical protein